MLLSPRVLSFTIPQLERLDQGDETVYVAAVLLLIPGFSCCCWYSWRLLFISCLSVLL